MGSYVGSGVDFAQVRICKSLSVCLPRQAKSKKGTKPEIVYETITLKGEAGIPKPKKEYLFGLKLD